MGFWLAADQDYIGFYPTVSRLHYGAIAPSERRLDSFGEINFAIHR
jgi:hypothetical protein